MNIEERRAGAPWNVHVVADSDTRWKWGASVASTLATDRPIRVHGHLLQGRATPNDQQLADVGVDSESIRRVGVARLLDDLATIDADVVVLSCVGGTIQSLLHALARAWQGRSRRPIVVTGYVGLVYERMVDGLMLRAGADVVLANSAHDTRAFREVYEAVGADPQSVVQTALPFLGGSLHDPTAAGRTRPFTVCFVAQPSVPSGLEERRYALDQTIEHARQHPERHVIVKLRARIGEQTTHVERHHFADLLPDDQQPPENLEFAYGSMSDVLDRTDLCVTISSTAALEAMHRDIPTAVLTDFGVRESLGNHAFLHAGVYTSWQELHDGAVPKTDPAWAADNGVLDDAPYDPLRTRVAELVDGADDLAPLRPWLGVDEAAGYLPTLLARNGIAPDGTALVNDPRWAAADPGVARRALRAGAQRIYRLSIRTIEPRVRKWAQL